MSRLDRVSTLLKSEIAEIIQKNLDDRSFGLVSVTNVKVSPDLHHATVFYSCLGVSESVLPNIQTHLSRRAGMIRYELGKRIRIKTIPKLTFSYDSSLQKGADVLKTLSELTDD